MPPTALPLIETEDRLDALVRYAIWKGRPLSILEYRYLKACIHWRREDRLLRGWFPLAIGFSAIFLGSLALSATLLALVLMFAGAALNILAAEKLGPREMQRTPRV